MAIRYRNHKYVIYSTDEKAGLWGIEYSYDNEEDAIKKYLELYHIRKLITPFAEKDATFPELKAKERDV